MGKLVVEKVPLLVLSAVSSVVTVVAQKGAMQSVESLPMLERIGNGLVTPMIYLAQMVYPAGLALFYPYPHGGQAVWEEMAGGMVLVGVTAVGWRQRGKRPWLWVGWLWYLVMLLPVVGIIQVGDQARADRYTYLPQMGIYVAIAWLAAEWGTKRKERRVILAVVTSAALAALMVCAWKQTTYWKDSETLWRRTLACTSGNYVAHFKLGNVLQQKGRVNDAILQYQKAVQLAPNYAQACNNLGGALLQEGRVDEAIPPLQKALLLNPGYGRAHNNLGNALLKKGDVAGALAQFQQALRTESRDPGVLNNLAWLLAAAPQASLRNGRTALELARQANALTGGNNPLALHTLAAALAETGRFPEAAETAQHALRLARIQSNSGLAETLELELKLYRTGSPLPLSERRLRP
jgi:tetratricopeptide (TPR) repeat protein